MSIYNILSLFGGLGLFLFGMDYMGDGLELAAGPKMKDLLEKLTRNRFMGFLLGALVTVVIQSSSATTVMVMGFINAGIMDLAQATGVIIGANIGTTITSVLIALDVSGIAPVCIALGTVMLLYARKKQHRYLGQVVLGFGMLFQGLHSMSSAMSPLKDSPAFQHFILNATNPLLGFLVGVVLCAVIQSSSAAVGVLQALAMQGLMPMHFAAFLVCGINVGSATPPLLSALKAKNNAKRAALIYLIFNIAGAALFMPLAMLTPLTGVIERLVPNPTFQISVFHILFKVVTGVLLLPFVDLMVRGTYKIVPKQQHESAFRLQYIDSHMLGAPAVMALQVGKEVQRMAEVVRSNLTDAAEGLIHQDLSRAQKIRDDEQLVDYLASEITAYLSVVNSRQLPESVSRFFGGVFNALNDLEQIGDHAVKILEQSETCAENHLVYTEAAQEELRSVCRASLEMLADAVSCFINEDKTDDKWFAIKKQERRIIKKAARAQANHMERLQQKKCSFEQGLTYIESLNSFLRIANHAANIAEVAGSKNARGATVAVAIMEEIM